MTIDGAGAGVIEQYEIIRLGRENLKLFRRRAWGATRFDVVVVSLQVTARTRHDERLLEDTLSAEMEGVDGKRPSMILLALIKAEGWSSRSSSARAIHGRLAPVAHDDRRPRPRYPHRRV